jgi:DNA-3-methyladenine glycosylase II
VTEQFLSLAAAKAIWLRVRTRLEPFDAPTIIACSQEELLGLGLSRAKAASFHGIASAALAGHFVPARHGDMGDDAVRVELMKLPGVGPWTAENYLLSTLLRPDAWPAGDVALQAAAHDLFALPERPREKPMVLLGERFRPYRSVAARLLWSHYRSLKAMAQV